MQILSSWRTFALLAAGALCVGCVGSSPQAAAGGTTTQDTAATGTQDTAAGAETAASEDTAGTTGGDTAAGADSASGKDTAVGDVAVVDTAVGDTLNLDTPPTDGKTSEASGGDTVNDTAKPPFACKVDTECKGLLVGPCADVKCDKGTCTAVLKADAAACEAPGGCGGKGSCKLGACNFVSPCGSAAPPKCTPTALKCGDKVSLDAKTMGASTLGKYSCGTVNWTGGEKAFTLSSDTTQVAAIELAGTGTWSAFDLLPLAGGLCAPTTCSVAGAKLTLGLPPGKPRLIVVDSLGTGTATLTVTCAASAPGCGDGKCEATESCTACAKDCGV